MAKNQEDWQVKQADAAFSLYDYFLSRELKRLSSGVPEAWKDLEQRMGEALRLRQRSLSSAHMVAEPPRWLGKGLSFF